VELNRKNLLLQAKVLEGILIIYSISWKNGFGDTKIGPNYAPTLHLLKKAIEKNSQILWLYEKK